MDLACQNGRAKGETGRNARGLRRIFLSSRGTHSYANGPISLTRSRRHRCHLFSREIAATRGGTPTTRVTPIGLRTELHTFRATSDIPDRGKRPHRSTYHSPSAVGPQPATPRKAREYREKNDPMCPNNTPSRGTHPKRAVADRVVQNRCRFFSPGVASCLPWWRQRSSLPPPAPATTRA